MDINKNRINNGKKLFDNFSFKSNTYIPALYQNTPDSFVLTTKGVSFKGSQIQRNDVLNTLNDIDIPTEVKEKIETHTETQEQINLAYKFLSNPILYKDELLQKNVDSILSKYTTQEAEKAKASIMDSYLSLPDLQKSENARKMLKTTLVFAKSEGSVKVLSKIFSSPLLYENNNIVSNIASIISWSEKLEIAAGKEKILSKYLSNPALYEDEGIQQRIGSYVQKANSVYSADIACKFLSTPELYTNKSLQKNMASIISSGNSEGKSEIVAGFLSSPELYENESLQESIERILFEVKSPDDLTYSSKLIDFVKKGDISADLAISLIKNSDKIRYKQAQKLRETIPLELFEQISSYQRDLVVASNLTGLYGKNNLNEIPLLEKKDVLRGLIQNNTDLFGVSKVLKKAFPLIPRDREEYCSLLPALVKSLGIETKPISDSQNIAFEKTLNDLSLFLANLSETEFHNVKITLSYPKNAFIEDTLAIVESLPKEERQKVFDYFGFDIKPNEENPTGYSIVGYPINLNNGEKLSQISNDKTKEAIERLRPKVVDFSENNLVCSNNKKLEPLLNSLLEVLPELNTTIGRSQHGAHEYDVFKHSLKVMQKVVQNPMYENLNQSDKKIILLASLCHDITKSEAKPDPLHAKECSFDAFYITQKFNLSKDEQSKLYTLINTHEWLKYVNQDEISGKERTQRLQSVAFDMQNGNVFELSKIFTEADIKSIKKDNGLFDAFGSALFKYAPIIEEYICELQKTKPILPTTKLPKASDIENKITIVNEDGSTNIKGLYKKDGLIVIKYNEVDNWEALGFSKDDVSRGIKIKNPLDNSILNTGTIKFIAHGLDEANQLINFDAFKLPDSDALLSVSYMERPESKYRLFRPQGILLDVNPNNIYGGGESDKGSGYKKSISDFKLNYIFDGERQKDRTYISDLIKTSLNLNDDEYIDFVRKNFNKSMCEIEPAEIRNALIKCFSLINSNVRQGNREYNEMYVSNPVVRGVYAYSVDDSVGEIQSFIEIQPEFLKNYAKQNDLPFFVFGE